MVGFLREYSLPLFSLFLIIWSIWRMLKDKKEGKPIAKKAIIATSISVALIASIAYIIVLK